MSDIQIQIAKLDTIMAALQTPGDDPAWFAPKAKAIADWLYSGTPVQRSAAYYVASGAYSLLLADGAGPNMRARLIADALAEFETARGMVGAPRTTNTEERKSA